MTYRATFFAEQIRVRHTPLYARLRAELQFFLPCWIPIS